MSGYERLYETHYANGAVRVMQQALMSVLLIVQMTHEAVRRLPVVEQEKATVTADDEVAAEVAAAQKTADAASGAVAASDQREQTRSGTAMAAGVRREQTEKQKNWTSRQMKQAGQVASVVVAASIQRVQTRSEAAASVQREQTKQDETGQAARVPAVIQQDTRSSWLVAIITVVLFMMMSATAGAAEHGLAPMTSQQLEWVSKLGEIQKTIDQLGELKRGDGWVQPEAAEAQRIHTDRAEETLQILGELNLNMRSEIEK